MSKQTVLVPRNIAPPRKMSPEEKLKQIQKIIDDYRLDTVLGIDDLMVEIEEVLNDQVEVCEVQSSDEGKNKNE